MVESGALSLSLPVSQDNYCTGYFEIKATATTSICDPLWHNLCITDLGSIPRGGEGRDIYSGPCVPKKEADQSPYYTISCYGTEHSLGQTDSA